MGQSDDDEPQVQYRQRTEIDFEGLDVSGELVKPQGALLLERRVSRAPSPMPQDAPSAPPDMVVEPSVDEAPMPEGLEPLQITATELDVVIPRLGEQVLYQHLLLTENEEFSIDILARRARRSTP